MPVHLYYGDESYLLNREIRRIRKELVAPEFAALSYKVLGQPKMSELLEAVTAVSFSFGNNTLIEIQDFPYLEKPVPAQDEYQLEQLKAALESLEPTKHILFNNKKIDKKVKFSRWLVTLKDIDLKECVSLPFWKTDEAVDFLLQEANRLKIQLTPQAATKLVDSMGVSFQPLVNELEKLSVYAAGRAITPEDVALLSDHNENAFAMLEQWILSPSAPQVQGNANRRATVFTILEEILLRQHPVQVFALLQSYLDNIFKLRLWKHLGLNEKEMAERTKKHPFKIKKDLETFGNVPLDRLVALKNAAIDLEWKAKTGQLTDRLALEVLLSQ